MATRFYFSVVLPEAGLIPEFSAWTRTTEGTRRMMRIDPDGSIGGNISFGGAVNMAANETILGRQFISAPMVAEIVFNTGVTVKGQIRCFENAANDNLNRQPIVIKIVSRDGTTVQATPKVLAHYGPATTEWPNVAPQVNRTLADGDALTGSYTTVAGDRLVLEIGGQVSSAGGTTVVGEQPMQSSVSSGDLPENETDATSLNPWFEFSNTITFESIPFPIQVFHFPRKFLRDYSQKLAFVPIVAIAVPPTSELLTLPRVQLHSIVQKAPNSIVGY